MPASVAVELRTVGIPLGTLIPTVLSCERMTQICGNTTQDCGNTTQNCGNPGSNVPAIKNRKRGCLDPTGPGPLNGRLKA